MIAHRAVVLSVFWTDWVLVRKTAKITFTAPSTHAEPHSANMDTAATNVMMKGSYISRMYHILHYKSDAQRQKGLANDHRIDKPFQEVRWSLHRTPTPFYGTNYDRVSSVRTISSDTAPFSLDISTFINRHRKTIRNHEHAVGFLYWPLLTQCVGRNCWRKLDGTEICIYTLYTAFLVYNKYELFLSRTQICWSKLIWSTCRNDQVVIDIHFLVIKDLNFLCEIKDSKPFGFVLRGHTHTEEVDEYRSAGPDRIIKSSERNGEQPSTRGGTVSVYWPRGGDN